MLNVFPVQHTFLNLFSFLSIICVSVDFSGTGLAGQERGEEMAQSCYGHPE